MSLLDSALDLLRAILAGGVSLYAYLTYRKLRGGMLAHPYLVFVVCGMAGAFSALADSMNLEVAHGLLGIIFYALLLLGLWFVYDFWSNLGLTRRNRLSKQTPTPKSPKTSQAPR